MIELVIADRCSCCEACVSVCPTNVFDTTHGAPPVIARKSDCQTCFMCELYCPAAALYVAPDCEQSEQVDEAEILRSGWLGVFRRDSGWGEWAGDPRYSNEHWQMERVFARARGATTLLSPEPADAAAPLKPSGG
jgi:NAD-dependent dihydropyrimidine dehydrogenase PreA subunit